MLWLLEGFLAAALAPCDHHPYHRHRRHGDLAAKSALQRRHLLEDLYTAE